MEALTKRFIEKMNISGISLMKRNLQKTTKMSLSLYQHKSIMRS